MALHDPVEGWPSMLEILIWHILRAVIEENWFKQKQISLNFENYIESYNFKKKIGCTTLEQS